ncbi:hypothetical protein E1B28_013134 [Marasmius oreades]|uniref:Uncharacterized protein n=1 Tax=Marasmius oreades TaxID=181124 RepID=A0A9P7UPK5_9AGAR|nr:uncharacterized protein E1B28_013134 [Marasmius oreades]KAG7087154.1 hypothetical protein E1B28_013134 [Marasmius oreades]
MLQFFLLHRHLSHGILCTPALQNGFNQSLSLTCGSALVFAGLEKNRRDISGIAFYAPASRRYLTPLSPPPFEQFNYTVVDHIDHNMSPTHRPGMEIICLRKMQLK